MTNDEFDKAIAHLKKELSQIRTGSANPSLVENIAVSTYDSKMPLNELAAITVSDQQLLIIQPWDINIIKDIEIALTKSEQQFNPVVDGEKIRISFPPLTEERRTEMVKLMHQKVEECRVSVRKIREEAIKKIKTEEKAGNISEDEYFREEKNIQSEVDEYNTSIKEIADSKEKDLMTV